MSVSPLSKQVHTQMYSLEKKLRACGVRIAKERDLLRDLLDEYSSIKEACDEAIDDIDRAADRLSELL